MDCSSQANLSIKGDASSRLLNYQKTNANGGLNLLLSANEFRENPILSIISLIFNKHPKDDAWLLKKRQQKCFPIQSISLLQILSSFSIFTVKKMVWSSLTLIETESMKTVCGILCNFIDNMDWIMDDEHKSSNLLHFIKTQVCPATCARTRICTISLPSILQMMIDKEICPNWPIVAFFTRT